MEAIILAGGFGTRLGSLVAERPKPMVPVRGRPFLAYIFDHIKKQGVGRVVLSVGYKHRVIVDYFGYSYHGMELAYAIEKAPLGTGGGTRQALAMALTATPLIMNGDTFFPIDLQKMVCHHVLKGGRLTMAVKPMESIDRYGVVELDYNGKISRFHEKGFHSSGLINAGVYVSSKTLFEGFSLDEKFSLEEFLQGHYAKLSLSGFVSNGYFIDIGIPEDYVRAQLELP